MKHPPLFKTCAFVILLMLSGGSALAATDSNSSSKVEWELNNNWKLPSAPVDLVHSLDGKKVFILTERNQVLVYTTNGMLEGTIPVDDGVTSIDINPRGNKLYLINNQTNSFAELNINYIVNINTKGSPFLGKPDAPVVVTVFTDFE